MRIQIQNTGIFKQKRFVTATAKDLGFEIMITIPVVREDFFSTCMIWRPRRRPICLRCPPGGRGVSAIGVSLEDISGADVSHETPSVEPDSECSVEVPVLLLLDNRWQYDNRAIAKQDKTKKRQ